MSILSYNNVNVSIDNHYLLAESVNVNQSSPQKPIYNLNNNVPFDNVPTTLKNSISLSYYVEPGNEPNYSIVTGIFNDTTTVLPSIINVGSIFITGYLSNYSIQLSPNGQVKANTSFDVFHPFTGNLIAQNASDSTLYDTLNSSGIGHYWVSNFFSGASQVSDNNILQMGYSASIGVSPIYSIGKPYPTQVYVNSITETLDLLTEQQFNGTYTGQNIRQNRPDLERLVLSGIYSSNNLIISMTGFIMSESKYDVSNENLIFFNNTYSRSR